MGRRLGQVPRAVRIVAATVAIAAALLPGTAVGQQDPHDPHDPHDPGGDGMLPPGAWTDAEKAALHDLIAAAERDLPQFADPDELPAGFHDFGGAVPAPPPEGGSYYHYVNADYIRDDRVLDPNYPESLVYHGERMNGEVEYHLVSAMFVAPEQYDMQSLPADIKWMPGWHAHPDVCVTDDYRLAGLTTPPNPCFSGRPWTEPPMMHVWIDRSPCDHRFGGIEVSGVHCHVEGTPGGKPVQPGPTPTPTPTPTHRRRLQHQRRRRRRGTGMAIHRPRLRTAVALTSPGSRPT